ncbi:hypothetical protein OHT59_10080 [Streptomyces sp. NBC_00243]|uniref:hypothetical protein n=1 Tax=Streptomyces sp. NBC_00243 TaxID=2975688 RepID=UPI002DD942AC|nr:hypothetical protein [Streptomyces sp. NBC_00243]WRZ18814.1 hypothetical protein OHT59_10080 [Streptomyces sp. NBC_00243]
MRMRTRGTLAALPPALALVLALALSGCGSEGDAEATGATASKSSLDDQGVKFAQCLREHGVDVEDPEPGKGLRITGKLPKGEVDKAMEACRKYDPMQNGAASADPEMEERVRKLAQCMRDNGVEEFPDPEPGTGGLQINQDVAEDPDFAKAQKACDKYAPDGGEGPSNDKADDE